MAASKGISVSALLREAIQQFEPPEESPKKARNLTIDEESNTKLQQVADEWFRPSGRGSGNRSDAVNYIIMQAIKEK